MNIPLDSNSDDKRSFSELVLSIVQRINKIGEGIISPVSLGDAQDMIKVMLHMYARNPKTSPIILQGLRAVIKMLEETKVEIGGLLGASKSEWHLEDMLGHLDAIGSTVEKSVQGIIEITEEINVIIAEEPEQVEAKIPGMITRILEACNIQDLTAQRLKKIRRSLASIDTHFKTIESKLCTLAPAIEEHDNTVDLLAGPQLPGSGLTQADIDALFG